MESKFHISESQALETVWRIRAGFRPGAGKQSEAGQRRCQRGGDVTMMFT